MTVRTTLALSEEAAAVLSEKVSERKRGELLSRLIVDWARAQEGKAPPTESEGLLERIEERLARLEGLVLRLSSEREGR